MNMMGEAREHHITIHDRTPLSHSDRRSIYRKLHLAALQGDWKMAKIYYSKYEPEISCNTKITRRDETVLHVAVTSDKVDFVKHVVERMSDDDLDLQDDGGNTAFYLAVKAGKFNCFDIMMRKKPNLAITRCVNHELPLYVAASRGYSKIIQQLYDATKSDLEYDDKINIFIALIDSNVYDVALEMLEEDDRLALGQDSNNETALLVLARKPSLTHPDRSSTNELPEIKTLLVRYMSRFTSSFNNFMRGERRSIMSKKAFELMKKIWDIVLELDDSEIIPKFSPLIFTAAEKGNAEFLSILLHSYPDLMFNVDDNGYTIFHVAVQHRQDDIFTTIRDFLAVKEKISTYTDQEGNNILHLAAKLPLITSRSEEVPGAALQLLREVLWFQQVKKAVAFIPCLKARNNEGQTPEDLFKKSHKDMLEEGEKWMKGTSSKCILVAALIATMAFQAILDVPFPATQENNQPTGLSRPSKNKLFVFFFVIDALSLLMSVVSLMIFLSIITSRYQFHDFYPSLYRKLIVGLATLYLSLAAMLEAFAYAISFFFYKSLGVLAFGYNFSFVFILAGLLVYFFLLRQLRLRWNVCSQTFRSDLVFKRNELLHKFFL